MPDPTPIDAVRHLISDVDPNRQILQDDHVDTYLALNDGNIRRAAADALDAIAVAEALVSKVIRTQDLQTDGPKLAAELRARADRLRQQADDEDTVDIFDIVDTIGTRRPEHTNPVVWGL